jgi:hypothetical protein
LYQPPRRAKQVTDERDRVMDGRYRDVRIARDLLASHRLFFGVIRMLLRRDPIATALFAVVLGIFFGASPAFRRRTWHSAQSCASTAYCSGGRRFSWSILAGWTCLSAQRTAPLQIVGA